MTRWFKVRAISYGLIGFAMVVWAVAIDVLNESWAGTIGFVGGSLFWLSYWLYWRNIVWRKRLQRG